MTCKDCNGSGKIVKITTFTFPIFGEREMLRKEDPCAPCKGTGKVD